MTSGDNLLVAAIDFGTTFSGYAFSFRHDYDLNRLNIFANTSWIAGGAGLVSWKTPTTLLLNADQSFNSFGYQAEEDYIGILDNDDEDPDNYYYFKRFKMLLHGKLTLDRNVMIKDIGGKEMPALDVFCHSIRYLKDNLMTTLENRSIDIKEEEIRFVLTIPAIWNEPAKQFMREAAVKAGILSRNLVLALEPEAASLYCKHIPVDRMDTGNPGETSIIPFQEGMSYMVLDLGGGTVDVTVHQVTGDDTLKELFKASGGAWGGTRVDQAFQALLKNVVTETCFDAFCRDNRPDLLDFERELELRKRTVVDSARKPVVMKVPIALPTTYEDMTDKSRDDAIKESIHNGKITFKRDKMLIDVDLFCGCFTDCTESIKGHVEDILKRPEINGHLDAIIMVGGFSESAIIVQSLRKAFPGMRVIVPQDAGLAVVKGAVLYGHCPTSISSRVCKFTYGIAAKATFKPGIHPESQKSENNGKFYCKNVFGKFIGIGENAGIGQTVKQSFGITSLTAPVVIEIFASTEPNPIMVTDEGCTKIGSITVRPPEAGWKPDTDLEVDMDFGSAEFTVSACDAKNKTDSFSTTFDFLE
ncbi:Heat shock 70 kDa protein 12B [Mizuhopecten yessoensis]|uniref:Heat shock 70 kDa protein n=2 Tax=Mizuhopecten yessoensis TaxID=6573 RepID=A0A1C9U307_MIZYE|nr:heat shock 70 kDa protein [Mizuhopecten yessoensis]OWF41867.1 Heat shock 70 kDa protein 12B [Mizuhopecten yessoensis]